MPEPDVAEVAEELAARPRPGRARSISAAASAVTRSSSPGSASRSPRSTCAEHGVAEVRRNAEDEGLTISDRCRADDRPALRRRRLRLCARLQRHLSRRPRRSSEQRSPRSGACCSRAASSRAPCCRSATPATASAPRSRRTPSCARRRDGDDADKAHPHFYCNAAELVELLAGFELKSLIDISCTASRAPGTGTSSPRGWREERVLGDVTLAYSVNASTRPSHVAKQRGRGPCEAWWKGAIAKFTQEKSLHRGVRGCPSTALSRGPPPPLRG